MKVLNKNIFACFMGFAVLSIFNINQSFAVDKGGVLLEPMVTYEKSSNDNVSLPAPFNGTAADVTGFGGGLRLGIHIFESAFVAADVRYSMPQIEGSAIGRDVDAKSWNYGPVIGIQMPFLIGLRAWAGWVAGGDLDPDEAGGTNHEYKGAGGWRVGAGFKIAFASLNVEYQDITYNNFASIEPENKSWVFSVSFPIQM